MLFGKKWETKTKPNRPKRIFFPWRGGQASKAALAAHLNCNDSVGADVGEHSKAAAATVAFFSDSVGASGSCSLDATKSQMFAFWSDMSLR